MQQSTKKEDRHIDKIARRDAKPEDVWKLLKHVDDLFHTRINILLATEGLLFVGVSRLYDPQRDPRPVPLLIGCVIGFFLTLLVYRSLLNLSRKLGWLQRQYCQIDPNLYGIYFKIKRIPKLETLNLFTRTIPRFFLAIWLTGIIGFTLLAVTGWSSDSAKGTTQPTSAASSTR